MSKKDWRRERILSQKEWEPSWLVHITCERFQERKHPRGFQGASPRRAEDWRFLGVFYITSTLGGCPVKGFCFGALFLAVSPNVGCRWRGDRALSVTAHWSILLTQRVAITSPTPKSPLSYPSTPRRIRCHTQWAGNNSGCCCLLIDSTKQYSWFGVDIRCTVSFHVKEPKLGLPAICVDFSVRGRWPSLIYPSALAYPQLFNATPMIQFN